MTQAPAAMSGAPTPAPPPVPASVATAGPVSSTGSAELPSAAIVRRPRWSWAWVLPVLALVLAGVFVYQGLSRRGPLITVEFDEGVGIGPGDPVSYRGVRVGDVTAVELTKD